ncbi:hypothetical protein [Burkholderia multivorans]
MDVDMRAGRKRRQRGAVGRPEFEHADVGRDGKLAEKRDFHGNGQ